MEKLYYTVAELLQKKSLLTLADILHKLIYSTDDAYVFVNRENNRALTINGGFLRIPKDVLQRIEIEAHKNKQLFFYDVKISHLTILKNEKIWDVYLILDELLEEEIDKVELDKFTKHTNLEPAYLEKASPFVKFRYSKSTETSRSITYRDIIVRSDSRLVEGLFGEHVVMPPHLDLNHHSCSERVKLFYAIAKAQVNNKAPKLSHTKLVRQVMENLGYEHETGEVAKHFIYITSPAWYKNPIKGKNKIITKK